MNCIVIAAYPLKKSTYGKTNFCETVNGSYPKARVVDQRLESRMRLTQISWLSILSKR